MAENNISHEHDTYICIQTSIKHERNDFMAKREREAQGSQQAETNRTWWRYSRVDNRPRRVGIFHVRDLGAQCTSLRGNQHIRAREYHQQIARHDVRYDEVTTRETQQLSPIDSTPRPLSASDLFVSVSVSVPVSVSVSVLVRVCPRPCLSSSVHPSTLFPFSGPHPP